MSIEVVVGMSDGVGTCRDKLCRIEDKMKLLSTLVRALPHNATGTEVEALRHDLTEALDVVRDATDAAVDAFRGARLVELRDEAQRFCSAEQLDQ